MGQDALWLVSHLFTELIVAAIAANIALGFDMITAVEKAIDYVQGAILHHILWGKGMGH